MKEKQWLACIDPTPMLEYLRGSTLREAAALAGLHIATICRWHAMDPKLRKMLRDAEREGSMFSRDLIARRPSVPWHPNCPACGAKALDVLARTLEKAPDDGLKIKAASEVLRLAQIQADAFKIGPTDPEGIVLGIVESRRRASLRDYEDGVSEIGGDLPDFDKHVKATWKELDALGAEQSPETEEEAKP